MSITLQQLRTPKTISNDNSQKLITAYYPNNLNVYEMTDEPVEGLKRNKVNGFKNLKAMESKRQRQILKRF